MFPCRTLDGPPSRHGFAAFVYDKELFVFGGFDGKSVLSDIWALDFTSATLRVCTGRS